MLSIPLTMRKFAFALACLAYAGYGRRMQTSMMHSYRLGAEDKGIEFGQTCNPLKRHGLSGEPPRTRSHQLRALAMFVLRCKPGVAFNPTCFSLSRSNLNNFHAVIKDRQHCLDQCIPVMTQRRIDAPQAGHATSVGNVRGLRASLSSLMAKARRLGRRSCALCRRMRPLASRIVCFLGLLAASQATIAAPAVASQAAEVASSHQGILQHVIDAVHHVSPGERDTMVLLLASALVTPLMGFVRLSPVLGFLFAGMVLGPNGLALVSDVSTTTKLAELGVVFFLFEMGLELEFEEIKRVSKDAFRLGTSQFFLTALAIFFTARGLGQSIAASVVLGGGLALSSSAFVIQLLQEGGELATRFGRAAFGTLLFQDLAVVPLLVVTPLLDSTGAALTSALRAAGIKAIFALATSFVTGRLLLQRVFKLVASAKDQTSFLAITLFTVLSMSAFTASLGLSDTLGAFLAGVLLAETKFRYQIEADIAPFRGILLGLFFITTGFQIDLPFALAHAPIILTMAFALHASKTLITTLICMAGGLKRTGAFRTGLILSQGGEFAFVIFALAQAHGILQGPQTKLLLTMVVITMFLTPFLSAFGKKVAEMAEKSSPNTPIIPSKEDEKDQGDYVLVAGFGRVGEIVCSLLTQKLIRYKAFDIDPYIVAEARERGLPVFSGDARRPDVMQALMNEGRYSVSAVVVALDREKDATTVVQALRRQYPNKEDFPIFVRAINEKHRRKLESSGAIALVTGPQEASLLLGGAALSNMGLEEEEVFNLIEDKRKDLNKDWMALIAGAKQDKKKKKKIADDEKKKDDEDDSPVSPPPPDLVETGNFTQVER